MIITAIRLEAVHVNHRGNWIFLTVHTDEGLRGIGELRGGNHYAARVWAVRELENKLRGRDPSLIEQIASEFTRIPSGPDLTCALSAVEQALWDILGQSLGVPVHALLGGRCRQEIRVYANINRATTLRTPSGFAENAAAAVSDGFDAIKLAPFDGMPLQMENPEVAKEGIACVRAVRAAIGPEVDLMVDCHSHFTLKGALEVAKALGEENLFWFEEPVREEDLEGCLEVKRRSGLKIAGGEERISRKGFRDLLVRGNVDVVMPDVTVAGGISELKKIAEMASAWNIPTSPHAPYGPVSLAASAQAMAATPGFLLLESAWGEVPWRADLLDPPEEIRKGRIQVSNRPGLGITLNQETLKAHRVSLE